MRKVDVTCAVIIKDGYVLAARRGPEMDHAGLWEFPGGKIKEGETEEACIVREIQEELSISIKVITRLEPSQHEYPGKVINLIPFVAEIKEGTPVPEEHDKLAWFSPSQLIRLAWPPADMPIVEQIIGLFTEVAE